MPYAEVCESISKNWQITLCVAMCSLVINLYSRDLHMTLNNIIGASLSEPHTSERFCRVNHARQKMDKNDCRLEYHTNSTKSRKNHSVDY